jgi:hypothetical protein
MWEVQRGAELPRYLLAAAQPCVSFRGDGDEFGRGGARGRGRDVSDSTLLKLCYFLFANHSKGEE